MFKVQYSRLIPLLASSIQHFFLLGACTQPKGGGEREREEEEEEEEETLLYTFSSVWTPWRRVKCQI